MSLLVPHCHPHSQSTVPPTTAEGRMETRRPSERSSNRRGRWSDLSQRLAVLRPPATQQLHHILGTLGHSSLNAQSVPQLLRQQLRTWEKGV